MSKKLNVLFLCGWYPSKILPTNGDFIQRHSEAVALKHTVTVLHIITDKNNFEKTNYTEENINGIKTYIAYLKFSKNPLLKLYFFLIAFKKLFKKITIIDVVHLNEIYPFGIFSLYLKWFYKKPFIVTEHFTKYLKTTKVNISFFEKIISKIIVRNAFSICPVSSYLANNLKEYGFKGTYKIVPNVIDTDLFIPKQKIGKTLKLVHVSALNNMHKNIKGMLNVAKLLDNKIDFFEWKFIGGDGKEYENYLKKLNLKNGEILFIEHLSHKELATHLQEASVCISFSNYETFGIVIPESIACGTPVIATETGIALNFKETNFCKVIPISKEKDLLDEILKSQQTFANLDTKKMHNFIKKEFSKEAIANKFSVLYNESLRK